MTPVPRRVSLLAILALFVVRLSSGAAQGVQAGALTHWCPMHPDQRGGAGAVCPVCKMKLVPIPPMRVGEYRMEVSHLAGGREGAAGLRLVIREPETLAPAREFEVTHERALHLFIVSRDLEWFAHVHPTETVPGTFEVRHQIPPGDYMVIADFVPAGGNPQTVQRLTVVPGTPVRNPRSELRSEATVPGRQEAAVDGIQVTGDPLVLPAGRADVVRFTFTDPETALPVTDLEPYLGAAAHLLVVSEDLTEAVHGHPDAASSLASGVVFELTLPRPGRYKLWLQFQRRGKVTTVPMLLEATSQPASR